VNLDALVAPLRADVVSGATVVARAAAAAMRRGAVSLPADSTQELRRGLESLAVKVLDAQPAMAPLVELLDSVLTALPDEGPVEEARRAAAEATERFRVQLEERSAHVARRLASALPSGSTLLTLSSSNTVRSGLVAAQSKGIQVVCLESRPMNEGQGLARTLALADIPVTLAVDSAAESLMPRCDLVILGADSVGDRGVVNKIGSVGLARCARDHSVPVWIAVDRSKWLPPGFPQIHADDRPADEVWKGARGVRVWNRYFECLPWELVDRIVTDEGDMTAEELDRRRGELSVAPALDAWAADRTRDPNP
jgi:translation initiation factor 2B subunit (eIF-2B alpha/beta/delta family)